MRNLESSSTCVSSGDACAVRDPCRGRFWRRFLSGGGASFGACHRLIYLTPPAYKACLRRRVRPFAACDVAKDACDIAKDACGIAKDACDIAKDACDIAKDACDIATDACGIANDACGIATDVCGIANDACGIANDACGIATDVCGIANDACGIASVACGKRENFSDSAIRALGLGKNCRAWLGNVRLNAA